MSDETTKARSSATSVSAPGPLVNTNIPQQATRALAGGTPVELGSNPPAPFGSEVPPATERPMTPTSSGAPLNGIEYAYRVPSECGKYQETRCVSCAARTGDDVSGTPLGWRDVYVADTCCDCCDWLIPTADLDDEHDLRTRYYHEAVAAQERCDELRVDDRGVA